MVSTELEFPKGFLWGAATSAHQVEGNNFNDWTEWERRNAKQLAEKARGYWQPWQQVRFPEMLEPQNYVSGRACDHYSRYEEDFDIAKSLGHNAHRFSIEWSRVEPKEGEFNELEIEHYQRVIIALRERRIEPLVTLYHWTLPLWFVQKGRWLSKEAPKFFERYVSRVSASIGIDYVNFWITINEPNVYALNCYLRGIWPPQQRSILKYLKVLDNLVRAHKRAYYVLKKRNPGTQVGISKNNVYFELIPFANYLRNRYFLDKIKDYQDFIGLNYYFHSHLLGSKSRWVSDLGWEIYPQGIYFVLKDLKKYQRPIYITENGVADADDRERERFIKEHLRFIYRGIEEGVDVRGYLYWALMDNFEWDKGFWPRFGLVEIDYATLERKVRPSAY